MERPSEKDYSADEGWIFANHIEAYYGRRLAECEMSLNVYDQGRISEYWLRHPRPVGEHEL